MCWQDVEDISASAHVLSCCPFLFHPLSNPFQLLRLQQGVLEKMEDPDLATSALDPPTGPHPDASWVQDDDEQHMADKAQQDLGY